MVKAFIAGAIRESAAGSAAASRIGSTKRFMGPHIHNVAIVAILSRTRLPPELKLPEADPAVIPALYGLAPALRELRGHRQQIGKSAALTVGREHYDLARELGHSRYS